MQKNVQIKKGKRIRFEDLETGEVLRGKVVKIACLDDRNYYDFLAYRHLQNKGADTTYVLQRKFQAKGPEQLFTTLTTAHNDSDERALLVQLPNGELRVIQTITFFIRVLPIFEQLVRDVVGMVKRIFKK